MASGSYTTMASMMGGPSGTAPVPTQSFNASNIFGTPVPAVGDSAARPNYSAGIGINPNHVIFVAVGMFAVGYIVYHVNFEK